MANDVRINVSADTKPAEKGFDRIKERAGTLSKETFGLNQIFGNFNTTLAALGIGSISAGFALKTVISTAREVAQVSASTELTLAQLGPEFQKLFDTLSPQFKEIGEEFGFTARDVGAAFTIMASISRDTTIDIDDLRFAMALARTQGIELADAAKVIGEAQVGNIEPLRDMIGEIQDLEVAQRNTIAAGEDAVGIWDKLGLQATNLKDSVVGLVSQFLEWDNAIRESIDITGILSDAWNTLKGVLDPIQDTLSNLASIIGAGVVGAVDVTVDFVVNTLPQIIKDFAEWVADGAIVAVDFVGFLVGTIANFVKAAVDDGKTVALSFFGLLFGFAQDVFDFVENGATIALDLVIDNITNLGAFISALADAIFEKIRGLVGLGPVSSSFSSSATGGGGSLSLAGLPSGGGGGVTINVQGDVVVDNEIRLTEWAEKIADLIDIRNRRTV